MHRASAKARADERRALRAELTDPAPVMEAAAAFLGVRQRSVEETRRRLVRLGYPAPLVEQVVARLIEMRYLDDDEFARHWVESRDRSRPRGENALRRELALKGIARELIDNVLAQRSADGAGGERGADHAAAQALLGRRRAALEREPDLRRRRQKAYALLARSGFDPETCSTAAATFAGTLDSTEIS